MDNNKKPNDFREAIMLLDERLSLDEKKKIMEYDEEEVGGILHFSLDLWIRNNWLYDENTFIYNEPGKLAKYQMDSYSDAIVIMLHRHLNEKPLMIEEEIGRLFFKWDKKI